MGLDTVQLVIEMEATFGIVIDDIDAETIGTVGQAYRTILGKLDLRTVVPCPSASRFYQLRRSLMARSRVDRGAIRPASRIADFLPAEGRREAWTALGNELGVTMPRLSLGGQLVMLGWLLWSVVIVGWVAFWVSIGNVTFVSGWNLLASSAFVGLGSLALIFAALQRFANELPPGSETIRGVVLATLGRQLAPAEGVAKTWHPEEVWVTLRNLVAQQSGAPLDRIAEETSFVHDLGMD